jgi:hypothetical protein
MCEPKGSAPAKFATLKERPREWVENSPRWR